MRSSFLSQRKQSILFLKGTRLLSRFLFKRYLFLGRSIERGRRTRRILYFQELDPRSAQGQMCPFRNASSSSTLQSCYHLTNTQESQITNVVLYRLQFLKHCDRIYLMNSGKIVEEGTHDELMEISTEYTAMVNSALLTTEDDEKRYARQKLSIEIAKLTIRVIAFNLNSFNRNSSAVTQIEIRNSSDDLEKPKAARNSGDNYENGEASRKLHGGGTLPLIYFVNLNVLNLNVFRRSLINHRRKGRNGYCKIIHVSYVRKSCRWLSSGSYSVPHSFLKRRKLCLQFLVVSYMD